MPGKKILVADDSLTIQKVIRLALSNEGYDIQAVSDGNEAIQQMSTFRPDVILVDVALPGKTAFELKNAVNALDDFRNVKFSLMSSAFEKVDETQVDQVRFQGRLTKPFDPGHLRQVILDALAIQDTPAASHGEEESFSPPPPGGAPPLPPGAPSMSEWSLAPPAGFPEPPAAYQPPDFLSEDPTPGHGIQSSLAAPPPPPSLHEIKGASPDSDIKELTESTIRMSGLDDFEWNIQEPSLKPAPSMMDLGETNFKLGIEHDESDEHPLDHPRGEIQGASIPNIPSFKNQTSEFDLPPSIQPPVHESAPGVMPLQAGQVEEIIRKQVKEEIEKLAKQILPGVAEKVIKQEIHRLLSELS